MRGMVVSASPAASLAGRDTLRDGGNAVDAAVTVALALAVTWPEAGNVGGGGFMMVLPAGANEPVCVDYRESAPAAAHATLYNADETTYSHRAVAVPGTVRGLARAHQQFGKLPWARLVQPALRLAADGLDVDEHLARSLNEVLQRDSVQQDARYAELRRVYGRPGGGDWQAGDRLVQPDLARTLQQLADEGADAFYRGQIAELLVAEIERGQGLITADDLAQYEPLLRTPVRSQYRGYDVFAPPPPSSGGICLGLMLHMLEPLELRSAERYSTRTVHLMAEAMRRAYAQRALHLGDPSFAVIPKALESADYARALSAEIDPRRATRSESLAPEGLFQPPESDNTTHFCVIDAAGMAVSNTYTLEASFGSRIVVRGAGFLLNNEMGDFNWVPGGTNRDGRVGTAANRIAPRKRMLSSQTPVIVLQQGRPVLLTGSPGGRTIINTVLTVLINHLEYQQDLAMAVEARRMHHQWFPDRLEIEPGDPALESLALALRAMGHTVAIKGGAQGAAHSIGIGADGVRHGVADWRRGGLAAGE
jgi:gamma-glutamyltranspeptidase / glutathione hydrolase